MIIKSFEIETNKLNHQLKSKDGVLFNKLIIEGDNYNLLSFDILVKNKTIFSLPLDYFFKNEKELNLLILKLFNMQLFPMKQITNDVCIEINYEGFIESCLIYYEEVDYPLKELFHFKNFQYFKLNSDKEIVSFNLEWILKSKEIFLFNHDIKKLKIYFNNKLNIDYSIISNFNIKKIVFDELIDYSIIKDIRIDITFHFPMNREIKLFSPVDNILHLNKGCVILVYPNYNKYINNLSQNITKKYDYIDYITNNYI